MYQIWDISSCSVVDEWWRAQLLLLATLGTAMNEMNVNLLFFGENTFQRPNTSGVSSPPRNFFSRLLVRRLLVGVTSSPPAHTRGGGFGWWCNSNTHYTYTIHDTQTHSRAVTQYTYVYMIHIITNTNIWAHALHAYMFNVQLFIHSPDTFWWLVFPRFPMQCNRDGRF